MKFIKVALLGIVLSTIVLFISATKIEGGDTNAASMYLVVFFIPAIILALLNAAYLLFIDKHLKGLPKIICGLIPILILIILSFQRNITLPNFDGDLSFLTTASAIGLGITYLVYTFSSIKSQIV